jgi:hypothetical protein
MMIWAVANVLIAICVAAWCVLPIVTFASERLYSARVWACEL